MNLESTLKKWCDGNLKPGMCYGGNKDGPITLDAYEPNQTRHGELVYQDGTACSASYAFHDVYLLDDGSYEIYTDCGQARMTGGEHVKYDAEPEKCSNLAEVLDFLLCFCGHDPNSAGDMLEHIIHNYQLNLDNDVTREWKRGSRIPVLAKCGDNQDLIVAIEKSRLGLSLDDDIME